MAPKDKKVNKNEEKDTQVENVGYAYLIEPWITEKSHEFMSDNKYVFRIDKRASKKQVKREIEKIYNVTVNKVNIINIPPKKRRFGLTIGFKSGFKKAIVSLKEGDSIQLFEGA